MATILSVLGLVGQADDAVLPLGLWDLCIGLALLKVTTIIGDFIATRLLPNRRAYRAAAEQDIGDETSTGYPPTLSMSDWYARVRSRCHHAHARVRALS